MSNIKESVPTIEDLRRVVNDLVKGKTRHGEAKAYNQERWCGTACCVWGHVWAATGHKVGGKPLQVPTEVSRAVHVGKTEFLDRLPEDLSEKLRRLFNSEFSKLEDFQKLLDEWPNSRVEEELER